VTRQISRRRVLQLVTTALAARPLLAALPAGAAPPSESLQRQTLEAWSDTIVPGAKRGPDDRVVAGATPGPGAVQAGVWQLLHDPDVGLAPALPALTTLLNTEASGYALAHGVRLTLTEAPFVALPFEHRTGLALTMLNPKHPDQLVWYALAAMAMLAFHTAAQLDTATAVRDGHPGLEWIGFPMPGRDGLWRFSQFSYRRQLAREHPATTSTGNPP
jgi:enediyne biosynthesis protein E8